MRRPVSLLLLLLLAAGGASAFTNWSSCSSCPNIEINGGSFVSLDNTPWPNTEITLNPVPSRQEDQFTYIESRLLAKDASLTIFDIDVVWIGDLQEHLLDLREILTPAEIALNHPSALAIGTVGDRLVAAPWYLDAPFLYYRKDLLAKYNFSGPPTTWDELELQASTIQEGERGSHDHFFGYSPGCSGEALIMNLIELFASHGGGSVIEMDRTVSINNPANLKALERFRSWIGGIVPASCLSGDDQAWFYNGQAAFFRELENGVQRIPPDLTGNVGITLLPSDGGGTRRKGCVGGWYRAVNKYAVNKQAAARLLMDHMVGVESQKRSFSVMSGLPTLADYFLGAGLCPAPVAGVLQLCDTLPVPDDYITQRWSVQASPNYEDTAVLVYTAVNKMLLGQMQPQECLDLLECQLTNVLHGVEALPLHCLTEIVPSAFAEQFNLIFTSIAVAIVLISLVMIMFCRNSPAIKAASPVFCSAICVGALILLASSYISSLPVLTVPAACWASAWLTTLGFSMMMGALFVKHWRVLKIFASTSAESKIANITNRDLLVRMGAIVLLIAVINGIWIAIQTGRPVVTKTFMTSACECMHSDVHEFISTCSLHPAGFWIQAVIAYGLIVWGSKMAYDTRNVQLLLFNESKYMGLCNYNMLVILLLAGPVLFFSSDPTIVMIVRSVSVGFLTLSTVIVLFGYKFYLTMTKTDEEVSSLNSQGKPSSNVKATKSVAVPIKSTVATKSTVVTLVKDGLAQP